MPCDIVILNVEGIDNALEVEQVNIRGTAEDCQSVKVIFSVGGDNFQVVVNVVNGEWLAEIEVEDVKCNASFEVMVSCEDGENECETRTSGNLRCVDPECPRLDDVIIHIPDECNANGEKEVEVTLVVTSPDARQVSVNFGNGINLNENLLAGQNRLEWLAPFEIPYLPGNYTISVTSLGCPDIEVPLIIAPCGEENPCPELISSEILIADECDEDGFRMVDVTLSISSPNAQAVTVNFGNGIEQGRNLLPGQNELSWTAPLSIPYAPGNYSIRVISGNCDDLIIPIEILPCPENECPIEFGEPSNPIFICNGDTSTVIISLGYDNNSNLALEAEVDYGNGQRGVVNFEPGQNRSVSLRSEYEPGGPYAITVSPGKPCDNIQINLENVPECLECPSFGDVDYSFGNCTGNTRTVTVEFGYDATHNCAITLDFGEDGSFPFLLPRGQNSIFREDIELPTGRELQGQILVDCEDIDCAPLRLGLKTVPDCNGDGCASYELVSINPGDCDDNGNRNVEVIVSINTGADIIVDVDFGNGQGEEKNVDAGEDELILRHSYRIGSSPTMTLDQQGIVDCDPFPIQIGQIQPCDPDNTPPSDNNGGNSGGGEGFGCMLGRWIMVIGAAIGIMAGLLITCIPAAAAVLGWIALGAGIVAVISGTLWAIFCPKPCGWGLLIAWQALLAAGVVGVYFVTCCPTLFWASLGSIIVAIGLAFAWARRCNIRQCSILTEISAVLVGAVIPLASNLFSVPVLNNCMNPIIQGIVSVIAAGLTLWALACNRNQNP